MLLLRRQGLSIAAIPYTEQNKADTDDFDSTYGCFLLHSCGIYLKYCSDPAAWV